MSEQDIAKTAKDSGRETVSESAPQYAHKQENPPFEEGRRYTYADYCTWGEDLDNGPDYKKTKDRYELIDGIPIAMAAPSWIHQRISGALFYQLYSYLKGKPCEAFAAPFDVRLNADSADDTVVQPDILVICDRSKLSGTGCKGAPDMTIEILSPGSIRHDRLRKLHQYEKYGVREYWIVDPDTEMLTVHILEGGRYYLKAYDKSSTVPVHILEGCMIDLAEVFGE